MARVMYFDAFSGAAGDMILGALIDAGLPVDQLRSSLGSLGVGFELKVTKVLRSGVSATQVTVEPAGVDRRHDHDPRHRHEHGPSDEHGSLHSHEHPHDSAHTHPHEPEHSHPHRTLESIAHHINHSALSTAGKARAIAMFRRLAEAEAAIHAMPVEDVHLHEVGALDSIIDIVGAVFALAWWGIDDIVVSPLNVGSGTVRIAHGTCPVPAPATLRLVAGVPTYSRGPEMELLTPTGALVLTSYARSFGRMPAMVPSHIGYGAGTRDIEAFPNVLRVVIGERADSDRAAAAPGERVLRIETAIDDMTPQIFGPLIDRLLAAGAVDAYLTPVVMKKGRPGIVVTTLAPEGARGSICDLLFRETTTIGVRFDPVERETLERRWDDVPVEGGIVRVKVAGRAGEVLNVAPEFDDCLRVAESTGQSVKRVQAEAMRVWSLLSEGRSR
jgi:uncharacterized protein (TIGR00299 family) protein